MCPAEYIIPIHGRMVAESKFAVGFWKSVQAVETGSVIPAWWILTLYWLLCVCWIAAHNTYNKMAPSTVRLDNLQMFISPAKYLPVAFVKQSTCSFTHTHTLTSIKVIEFWKQISNNETLLHILQRRRYHSSIVNVIVTSYFYIWNVIFIYLFSVVGWVKVKKIC